MQVKKQLEKKFNTCTSFQDPLDIPTFMSNLMGDFQGVVQYNNEQGPTRTIDYVCGIMIKGKNDPLQAYADVATLFYDPCMNISYADMIAQLQDVDAWGEGSVGMRQWTYQSCNEFGYFQSTDSDNQPFGDLVPIEYWTRQCNDIFGVEFDVDDRVAQTNLIYGGRDLPASGATNILFVNGNIDPWHSLSVTKSISDSVKAILIDGTAHCRNISPPGPNDPPGLEAAQKETLKIIGQWLIQ